ncbi:MAG: LmeA family phospholipid-binding protein, partial [Microcystaceae cyanobacterium]
MEFLTIFLSSLLAAISPAGLILETVVENTLRDRVEAVEQLEVRIDNTPSYQVLQGKVDRVRIASRGVEPIPHLRIEALE